MCFASSYAGAFFQLIMGLIGVPGLCSFIVACRVGSVGFMFVYFHVCSFCDMFLFCFSIWFILFLYFCVGLLLISVILCSFMKSFTFCSYLATVSMTVVFPLFAFVIVRLFSVNFFFMFLIVFHSLLFLLLCVSLLCSFFWVILMSVFATACL
jgi:hypothetical protein